MRWYLIRSFKSQRTGKNITDIIGYNKGCFRRFKMEMLEDPVWSYPTEASAYAEQKLLGLQCWTTVITEEDLMGEIFVAAL